MNLNQSKSKHIFWILAILQIYIRWYRRRRRCWCCILYTSIHWRTRIIQRQGRLWVSWERERDFNIHRILVVRAAIASDDEETRGILEGWKWNADNTYRADIQFAAESCFIYILNLPITFGILSNVLHIMGGGGRAWFGDWRTAYRVNRFQCSPSLAAAAAAAYA